MDPEEVAIVLVENHKGEFLFLRRTVESEHARASAGKWVPPGGHVERGGRDGPYNANEAYIEAAKRAGIRETAEESGLDISNQEITHISTFVSQSSEKKFLTHLFYVKLPIDMPIDIRLSEMHKIKEHDMSFWIARDLMINQILNPLSELRGDPTRPLGRHDYTQLSWEIVERGLVPIRQHGKPVKAV